jgi:hypothetical protein
MAATSDLTAFSNQSDLKHARHFLHAEAQSIRHALSTVLWCHKCAFSNLSASLRDNPENCSVTLFCRPSGGWYRLGANNPRLSTLAAHCPGEQLWQDVLMCPSKWAFDVIRRSQSTPVHCTFEPYHNTSAFEYAISRLSRIQELSLDGEIGLALCMSLNNALTHLALILRSFSVDVDLTVAPRGDWSPPDNLSILQARALSLAVRYLVSASVKPVDFRSPQLTIKDTNNGSLLRFYARHSSITRFPASVMCHLHRDRLLELCASARSTC